MVKECDGILEDGTPCLAISCVGCPKMETKREYAKRVCEECGNELEIWLDQVEESSLTEEGLLRERRHLMWHCTECGCDYENYWESMPGGTCETPIQRKYWG